MITIYTMPGCMSCKKTKNYLKENQVEFEEKNIYVTLLIEEEIKKVIQFFYGKEEKYVTLSPAFEATLKKALRRELGKKRSASCKRIPRVLSVRSLCMMKKVMKRSCSSWKRKEMSGAKRIVQTLFYAKKLEKKKAKRLLHLEVFDPFSKGDQIIPLVGEQAFHADFDDIEFKDAHFEAERFSYRDKVKLKLIESVFEAFDRVIGKSFFVYECGFHTDLLFVFHMYSIQRIYRFLRIV